MKKFISISKVLLAFSLTYKVTGAAATLDENGPGSPGESKEPETKDQTKEYVISTGQIVELPEDNEYVKGLVAKKLIKEYEEPAEPVIPPANLSGETNGTTHEE